MELSEARDLFERSYAAWSRADADALVLLYDPDCEWDLTGTPVDPIVYRGHAGLRRAVADWVDNWRDFQLVMAELTQLGDEMFFVVGQGRGVGNSGVPVELPGIFQVITTRGGKILAVRNFLDRDQALAAASAEEP